MHPFSRTELLIGPEGLNRLKNSTVAVFGLGGVGSFAAESLARVGIGKLILVDHDRVSLTNLNRQLVALHNTIGQLKTDVMKERIAQINPQSQVEALAEFYSADNREQLIKDDYSYIVDAIDTVSAKLDLIETALTRGIPVVTSMGAANKLDPSQLRIGDISETQICPLAKVMRKELRKRGYRKGVKVVYSLEAPLVPRPSAEEILPQGRRSLPGSIAFVPPVAGMFLASVVVNDLLADIIQQQERKG